MRDGGMEMVERRDGGSDKGGSVRNKREISKERRPALTSSPPTLPLSTQICWPSSVDAALSPDPDVSAMTREQAERRAVLSHLDFCHLVCLPQEAANRVETPFFIAGVPRSTLHRKKTKIPLRKIQTFA